jgi:hypothetical protein
MSIAIDSNSAVGWEVTWHSGIISAKSEASFFFYHVTDYSSRWLFINALPIQIKQ